MATSTEHYELLLGAVVRIQGLGLQLANGSALAATQVVGAKLPTDRVLPTATGADGVTKTILPGVIVAIPQEGEDIGDGNFEQDYVGYPLLITHVFAANQALALDETPLRWRKQLRRAFHEKRLATANPAIGAFHCVVVPRPIINVGLFREQNLDVGALLVRAFTSEDRDKTDNEA